MTEMQLRKVSLLLELADKTKDSYDAVESVNPYPECYQLNLSRYPFDDKMNQRVGVSVLQNESHKQSLCMVAYTTVAIHIICL